MVTEDNKSTQQTIIIYDENDIEYKNIIKYFSDNYGEEYNLTFEMFFDSEYEYLEDFEKYEDSIRLEMYDEYMYIRDYQYPEYRYYNFRYCIDYIDVFDNYREYEMHIIENDCYYYCYFHDMIFEDDDEFNLYDYDWHIKNRAILYNKNYMKNMGYIKEEDMLKEIYMEIIF